MKNYNRLLWALSFVFFVGGAIALMTKSTSAQTVPDYTVNYAVNLWRNLNYTAHGTGGTTTVGPAGWKVTGRSGETNFCEIWTVANWRQNPDSAMSFANSSTPSFPPNYGNSQARMMYFFPAGLYSATDEGYFMSSPFSYTAYSWPESWEIRGYMAEDCE